MGASFFLLLKNLGGSIRCHPMGGSGYYPRVAAKAATQWVVAAASLGVAAKAATQWVVAAATLG